MVLKKQIWPLRRLTKRKDETPNETRDEEGETTADNQRQAKEHKLLGASETTGKHTQPKLSQNMERLPSQVTLIQNPANIKHSYFSTS